MAAHWAHKSLLVCLVCARPQAEVKGLSLLVNGAKRIVVWTASCLLKRMEKQMNKDLICFMKSGETHSGDKLHGEEPTDAYSVF